MKSGRRAEWDEDTEVDMRHLVWGGERGGGGVIRQEGTIRWDDLWAKEDAWRERKLKEKKEKERKEEERKKDGK